MNFTAEDTQSGAEKNVFPLRALRKNFPPFAVNFNFVVK